jgi:hypothetical protein
MLTTFLAVGAIGGMGIGVFSSMIAYRAWHDNRRFREEDHRRTEQRRQEEQRLAREQDERRKRQEMHQAEFKGAGANLTKLHRVCVEVITGGVPLTAARMERFRLGEVCWELRSIAERIPSLRDPLEAAAKAAMELSQTGVRETAEPPPGLVEAGRLAIAQYRAALDARERLETARKAMEAEWGV